MKLAWLTVILILVSGGTVIKAQVNRAKDPNVPCVVVAGAVNVPLRFELKGKTFRLLEALSFAGGPSQRASTTVQLIRTEQACYSDAWSQKVRPDRTLKITEFNLAEILRGNESANPSLIPGDVVLVDESDPIYVSGRVATPRPIYFKKPPTLLDAIGLAGGAVNATSETRVVVLRAGEDGRYKEFLRISLDELKKHPKRSPLLQSKDIIDVGPTGLLTPPLRPPPFDSPLFDRRPSGPAAVQASNVTAKF